MKYFIVIGISGYVNDEEYEERKRKVEEGAREVLNYISPTAALRNSFALNENLN